MKYYLHDTSSFDDEKITELFLKFGYEGLGLFYTILEKIGKQEKPVKTGVLKAQLRVGKRLEKCWSFMEQIGIISSKNGETFNEQLLNYSETYEIKKQKTREKIREWREKQKDAKNVTGYESVCNPPKVKLSKVNTNKDILLSEREEIFLNEVMNFKDQYPEEMLKHFSDYWTEKNKSKTKMRYELEKTFELSKRIAYWASRDKDVVKKVSIPDEISYKELVQRFNDGETAIFEKYEIITPGDKRSLWRRKTK